MREKLVEIKLIDGSTWYVSEDVFDTFNVPEDPKSVISNYIRGSRGPLLKVNSDPDKQSGEERYINATLITSVKIYYDGNRP